MIITLKKNKIIIAYAQVKEEQILSKYLSITTVVLLCKEWNEL